MPSASVYIENLPGDICSPFFGEHNTLLFISQESGEVYSIDRSNKVQRHEAFDGQPSGALYARDGTLLVADPTEGGIVGIDSSGNKELVVGVYEDRPLKGPNSLAMDGNGNVYFTDSGPFGETGLHSPHGSLFKISYSHSGQVLQPVAVESLAYPWGVAISPDSRFVYVAETMSNRVLRYFQRPEGVCHASVFIQLSGRVGPSALACDQQGSLYVAHYDILGSSREGVVYVVSAGGAITSTISVAGPDITGLAISPDNRTLYITERTTKSIYRIEL